MTKPLNMLVITSIDYVQMWTNVEHSRVRHYSQLGHSVTVLYMRQNKSAKVKDMIRDTCTWRSTCCQEGLVRLVEVDPFFNYYAGLRLQSHYQVQVSKNKFSWRRGLVKVLSPLTAWRDVGFVLCFLGTAAGQARRPYDVCLGIGPWGSLVGWLLRKLGKVRCLVYEDRDFEPGLMPGRLRYWNTAWAERFGIKRADVVVTVGRRLARLRQQQMGRQVNVIPNGVFWDRFEQARSAKRSGRTLFYSGTLFSWSGLEPAVRAMVEIRRSLADVRLVIVGSGLPAYEACLRGLVGDLHLEGCVEFVGSVPNDRLPLWLAKADVGLSNSKPVAFRTYACPLKVIEYMAAGLPVIATSGTEAGDMVERFGCGLSVGYDVGDFAEAVIRLFQEPGLYPKMQHNAVTHSAKLDWTHLLNQELSLIQACQRSSSQRGDR